MFTRLSFLCLGLLLISDAVAAQEFKPLALPVVTPEQKEAARQRTRDLGNGIIEYDLRTSIERRLALPPEPIAPIEPLPAGDGYGVFPTDTLDSQKNFSGHYLISDPTTGIYPKHVKLFMTWRRVDNIMVGGACSGTLIGPSHVITAGHCVYRWNPDVDGTPVDPWAISVTVEPGWNMAAGPFGNAIATGIRSWTGWTQNEDYDHDVAVLTLSRPVGALVGWEGFGATTNWDWFDDPGWRMYAYPGRNVFDTENLGGQQMYMQSGDYQYDDAPQYGSDQPSYKGTSGGGAIKSNVVWGVRSHFEVQAGDVDTYDTALTSSKLSSILGWMATDLPNSSDILPMDVQATPESETAGNTLSDMNFLIHNRSDAAHTGGTAYTVYLGVNDVTTQSDIYVTSGYVSNVIPAGGSYRVTVPEVVVPPALATGDYFLGVFITTVDANVNNNMTREQDTLKFAVTCAAQAVPQPVNPVNQHPCVGTDITLAWGSVPGIGVDYQVELTKSAADPDIGTTTSIIQHLFTGLEEATWYYWRVRALPDCGGSSAWSAWFSFRTEGFLWPVALIQPAPDLRCVPTTTLLAWNEVDTADMYRIRFENIGTGAVQIIDTPDLSYVVAGLDFDEEYRWQIKARNACLVWGQYGTARSFFTVGAAPVAATPVSPVGGAFSSVNPSFEALFVGSVIEYDYELETAANVPVAIWQGPWQSQFTGLVGGLYRWRVRALTCTNSGDVYGAWSAWNGFEVDDTLPVFIQQPIALSPPVSIWTSNDLVSVEFFGATDNCCIAEYWVTWDQSPDTVPDNTTTTSGPNSWELNVPEGENWFHVVAVDGNGNLSAPGHVGPFLVDLGGPTEPIPEGNIPTDAWSNVDDLVVTWPPAVDLGSGVAGYSLAWTSSSGYPLDTTIDTTELSTSLLSAEEGWRYFYIRAIDNLGNASAIVEQRYLIDRTDPTVDLFYPAGFEVFQSNSIEQIQFNAQDNAATMRSMVTEHYYSVDNGVSWYGAICAFGCGGGQGGTVHSHTGEGPYPWRVPWAPDGPVLYRIVAIDNAGNSAETQIANYFSIQTSVGADELPTISKVSILGNSPNPFNPRTTIRYAIPGATRVELELFDISGRLVRTLVSAYQDGPAEHSVSWDGIDAEGRTVASGVYIYRLRADGEVQSGRMTLLK